MDGTDFRIQEPKPFWKGWYSFKFNGPGLRYEVGVCILTGDIVWTNGPFPCGKYSDITIFRLGMLKALDDDRREKVEADKGYRGEEHYVNTPPVVDGEMAQRVRSRHETVNKRFKQWKCLKDVFQHNLAKHHDMFTAVAVVTQLAMENGEPLFNVEYY